MMTNTVLNITRETLTERQIENRLTKLEELEKAMKELKTRAEALREEIQDSMTEDFMETKAFRIFWKVETRTTLDGKKLKSELPDVWQKYAKTQDVRPFKVNRK